MKHQQGFTLIELVIVIVILGILAAAALPRFINVTVEARQASVDGLAGAMRSAVALAKAQYIVDGNTASTSITMDGQAVTVAAATGVPTAAAAGIGSALLSLDGYTPDYVAAPNTFRPTNGGSATCQVTYTAAGVVTAVKSAC